MNNPIIFTYSENRQPERYAVHADGSISRPAIGMGPSGRWQFVGLASGHGTMILAFLPLCRALADGQRSLPTTCYVRDVDCGTHRQHGGALDTISLHPDRPHGWLELVERLAEARVEVARRKALEAAAARLAEARKAKRLVARVGAVEVRKSRAGFYVIDGVEATEALTLESAAQAFGAALIESEAGL